MMAAPSTVPARQALVLLALPVDDECEMYEAHLSFDGFRVVTAQTIEQLRDQVRCFTPDAIVLGQRLGSGGEQVCRELKADAALANVPCVLLTSYQFGYCPCDATLVRPVIPQVLADTVKLLLNKLAETV